MIVDCDRCEVRGDACGDCVITALLGSPPGGVRFDATERRAIDALAGAGLVPRLRLVPYGASTDASAPPGGRSSGATPNATPSIAKRSPRRAERSSKEAG